MRCSSLGEFVAAIFANSCFYLYDFGGSREFFGNFALVVIAANADTFTMPPKLI